MLLARESGKAGWNLVSGAGIRQVIRNPGDGHWNLGGRAGNAAGRLERGPRAGNGPRGDSGRDSDKRHVNRNQGMTGLDGSAKGMVRRGD
jgi:hypothetical protein